MQFPLTDELLREVAEFELRSACCHCFFFVASDDRCALEWPMGGQKRWPLDAPVLGSAASAEASESERARPAVVDYCKEFELR